MKLKENRSEEWNIIIEKYSQTPELRKELRFVMQWITRMEMEVERGLSISVCAKKTLANTSHQFEGAGCQLCDWVDILEQNWIYGDDLKEWYKTKDETTFFYTEAQNENRYFNEVHISRHARKRMHERCGVGKKAGQKLAVRAIKEGIKIEDTVGVIRSYLSHIFCNTEDSPEIRLLGETVFVFKKQPDGYLLITVMKLPSNYAKYKDEEIIKGKEAM